MTLKGLLNYNSAEKFLACQGQCFCDGYEGMNIEFNHENECTLILNDKNLSKRDQVNHLKKTIEFLESNFQVIATTYKEELRSGQSVEYPMNAYLQSKTTLPTTWEGGKLDIEDGKLKKVIPNPALSTGSNNEHLAFLDLLKTIGVDFTSFAIEMHGALIDPETYYNQLIEVVKAEQKKTILVEA